MQQQPQPFVVWAIAVATGWMTLGVAEPCLASQTQSLPSSLSSTEFQQINRDLTRSVAQDFFQQGRVRLEQEIQVLIRQRLSTDQRLLQVDKQTNTWQPPSSFNQRLSWPAAPKLIKRELQP